MGVIFTKAAQTGKHLPAQLFDADEICAEYYRKLIQQVLPHSFRRSSGQDFAALYKV